MVSSAENK